MDEAGKKKLLDTLQVSEAIFKYSAEAIVIVDEEGIIMMANPNALELFGYTDEELIGQPVDMLVPDKIKGVHKHHVNSYNVDPKPRAMAAGMELFARRKSGKLIPINISLSPVNVNGKKFTIALVIDISEIKESKQKLHSLNQELELKVLDRTRELAEMVNKLETTNKQLKQAEEEARVSLEKEKELNELKSRFVSMASHEFRTPLSSILSSTVLLEKYGTDEKFNERRDKHMKRIKSNVRNLTVILNDFLSLDKLQENKITCYPESFNLKELLFELMEDLSDIIKKGQQLNIDYTGDEMVCQDKNMMRNICLNLVSNAIKYSAEEKPIQIMANVGKSLSLHVIDKGVGIPQDEQNHMFERFFRAKNVLNVEGTGLGLTIVKKYLELMGGTIDFRSEYMVGTTFMIDMPVNYSN